MKRYILCLATAFSLTCVANSQSAYENLAHHCYLYLGASLENLLISSTSGNTHTLLKQAFGPTSHIAIYSLGETDDAQQKAIPNGEIASTLWGFISRQLHREQGVLSTEMKIGNLFLVQYGNSFVFVHVLWSELKNQWAILCYDPQRIKLNFTVGVQYFRLY